MYTIIWLLITPFILPFSYIVENESLTSCLANLLPKLSSNIAIGLGKTLHQIFNSLKPKIFFLPLHLTLLLKGNPTEYLFETT